MGTSETFDHTADVGFRVRGQTLDDLFATAAAAMFDYIVANRAEVRAIVLEPVEVRADSAAELLAGWLDELLFRSETRHLLYATFRLAVAADGLSLQATIGGEAIDRERHVLDHEVKAVTRHGFMLVEDAAGWTAEFILDI